MHLTASVTASTQDKNLRIAIMGSLAVHALLFLLLAWLFAGDAATRLWQQATAQPREKEVTLIYPEMLMAEPEPTPLPEPPKTAPPPPPPEKREVYIRTSQNETAAAAPKNAPFISDRNTTAATVKAPSPNATEPMPTMEGLKLPTQDMADRDYHNGQLRDDSRQKTPPSAPVAMLQPMPQTAPTPDSVLKPKDAAPAPQPVTPPPQEMAKTVPESTPLTRMMEEADKELARIEKNRLSLEVKKAEPAPDTPPPPTEPQKPQVPAMREVADAPPPMPNQPVPKALPVPDNEPVTRNTPNAAPDAFTPFTRVQETKGTISNRGTAPAVDAEDSPKGRYIRQVTGQVEKKWHIYRLLRRDGVMPGALEITFYVNKKGKVEDMRVVNDKESNPILTNFTIQAIRDAEIPPIPTDVLPSLPMNDQERLKVEYNVLIY